MVLAPLERARLLTVVQLGVLVTLEHGPLEPAGLRDNMIGRGLVTDRVSLHAMVGRMRDAGLVWKSRRGKSVKVELRPHGREVLDVVRRMLATDRSEELTNG